MTQTRFSITIGRQFGAGGRELGQRLAQLYGIAYYDKELIAEVARETGLSPEFVERADEQVPTGWMHALAANLAMGGVYSAAGGVVSGESLFKFQAEVILQAARRESCVIVGRCADYILQDCPLNLSLFVCASDQQRVARIVRDHGAQDEKQAREMMHRIDKRRENYYNFYTDKHWGRAATYDLCVDSSRLGIDGAARVVQEYVRVMSSSSSATASR